MSAAGRRSVAFVTHAALPALTPDDQLAIAPLAKRGIDVVPARWDDAQTDWRRFDLVVLRSTWDYWRRVSEFRAWLERMACDQVRLWNPPRLALWSMEKHYLRDLEEARVPVVATRWLRRGADTLLQALLEENGWDRAVIKPVISGNADGTWTTCLAGAAGDELRFRGELAERDLMVQQFVEAIAAEGEWSLVFIGSELSHTIIKQPAPGDFRVQHDFAGTARAARPAAAVVELAHAALAQVPSEWLYARVDLVHAGDEYRVMELELLEPSLFMAADPERAPERFADAVAALVR
jgi:glutathione synthase/RimK-type ligase-like ATP-grasp enzyme